MKISHRSCSAVCTTSIVALAACGTSDSAVESHRPASAATLAVRLQQILDATIKVGDPGTRFLVNWMLARNGA